MLKKLVDFEAFEDFGIRSMFEDMGWIPFIELDEFVYPGLVREFYENLAQTGLDTWTTIVAGHEIPINEQVINRILVAPEHDLRIYSKKGWPNIPEFDPRPYMCRLTGKETWNALARPESKHLTLPAKIVSHILGYTVYPISGHRNTAGIFLYFVTDCLMTRTKLSLGYIIMQHMVHIQERGDLPLPYGEVITRILGVRRPSLVHGDRLKSTDRLNAQTLRQMKIFKENGQWVFHSQGASSSGVSYPAAPRDEVQEELDAAAAEAGLRDDDDHGGDQAAPSQRFEFTEYHYNQINSRLDNLSLSVSNIQQAQMTFYDFMYAHYGHPQPQQPPPDEHPQQPPADE